MDLFDIAVGLTKVGFKTAVNVGAGVVDTVGDAAKIVKNVADGEYEKAGNIAIKRVENTIVTGVKSVEYVAKAIDHGLDCIDKPNKKFFSDEMIDDLSKLGAIAVGGYVAIDCLSDDINSDISYYSEDGKFVGDSDDLQSLTALGEVEDSEHINSDEIVRDISARNEFLAMHGYDSVPEGYEVHHIVPLSEGGADSSDNMILVESDDHDKITATHARYYNWR